MNDCIFCRIANKELPAIVIDETENVIVFLSLENHPLVVPKKHFQDIYDLDEGIGAEIMKEVIKVAKAVKESLHCEGVNLLQSSESAAGQDIFHFHLHVKPRWKDDGVHLEWDISEVDNEQRMQRAQQIREALS